MSIGTVRDLSCAQTSSGCMQDIGVGSVRRIGSDRSDGGLRFDIQPMPISLQETGKNLGHEPVRPDCPGRKQSTPSAVQMILPLDILATMKTIPILNLLKAHTFNASLSRTV